jgi:hypothetical protein
VTPLLWVVVGVVGFILGAGALFVAWVIWRMQHEQPTDMWRDVPPGGESEKELGL